MKGFRRDNPDSELPKPGQYGRDVNGNWFGCCPRRTGEESVSDFDCFHANLAGHEVVEHPDGSITVSPSILVTSHRGQWHGHLERGEWKEC